MRVIAGEKRHIQLKTLDSLSIRPTTDKIKETLFNMIQFELSGINFLDLFAGSGAIGIEALSRGSKSATFIEKDIEAIKVIKENLEKTKLTDKAKLIKSDVSIALLDLKTDEPYHIVFMDPPYDMDLYMEPLKILQKSDLIDQDSKIIIETSKNDDIEKMLSIGYELIKEKIYKSNKHIFLRRK